MMPGGRGGYNPYATNSNSHAIRQEIQRFESVHPSIYAIYDLIDLVPDPHLAQQIREHVVCIEGRKSSKSGKSNHWKWNPGNQIIEIREDRSLEIQWNQIMYIRGIWLQTYKEIKIVDIQGNHIINFELQSFKYTYWSFFASISLNNIPGNIFS